ncbi:efflux RND transporter periplasmic adaptor subunit [Enterovirga aerilata]|uniref:Efflux RND transporter periplasmic adaptor subunit n=1 Tax=Enterovirga aerilata TaxID=2730920 RepID=A0A849I890_9HYPH|nr:efflux RND transporter periplasmic adaptor subunit [Enterovirga sp. DB1703]NNM73608.1 efflux RND transporter periplasmic adaptor subunit [Enterovirga sp. DB1703]
MSRVIFAVLVVAASLLWWKREDAGRFVAERVPAAAPYLAAAPASQAAAQRAAPAVPVVLANADRKPLPVTIDAVGTVQPLASIQIKARVDSQITSIAVQEGAKVKEGDLLVTLDNRAIKAQLAQAEALVAKDRAQLEQARRDLARAEDLLAKRITTEVQRDTYATAVKVQEAQLAADEASRANLATALSYTEIRAPVSGRIGSIALKEGTMVKAVDTQAIMTVNQLDPIYASFAVPQSLFGDLRRAMSAGKVAVEARVGDGVSTGTVAFTENTVDLATGTVLAKALMDNADERLWPGAFVSVRVVLGIQSGAVAVPSAAVQIGQQGNYVFVVRDGRKAELVPVTVARTVGNESVISSGLSGGERVVVDGQLRLVNGAAVQVVPARGSEGVAKGLDPEAGAQRRS